MDIVKSSKGLLMIGLVAITLLLSVGYSSVSQDVRDIIETPSYEESALNQIVKIVRIEPVKVSGLATSGVPSISLNSATFNASLVNSGDFVKYEVTLQNASDKVAKLRNVSINEQLDGAPTVKYSFNSPSEILEPGAYTTVTVEATYDDTYSNSTDATSKIATILYEYSIGE